MSACFLECFLLNQIVSSVFVNQRCWQAWVWPTGLLDRVGVKICGDFWRHWKKCRSKKSTLTPEKMTCPERGVFGLYCLLKSITVNSNFPWIIGYSDNPVPQRSWPQEKCRCMWLFLAIHWGGFWEKSGQLFNAVFSTFWQGSFKE